MNAKHGNKDDVILDQDGAETTERSHDRVSSALISAATGYIRQLIHDASIDHRNGRGKSFGRFGVSREIIKQVETLSPIELEEALYSYARSALMRSPTLANPDFEIDVLLTKLINHNNDKGMLDSYLLAGASNELMKLLFGTRPSECAKRRIFLGIETKPGRKTEKASNKTVLDVYDKYESALKIDSCKKQALLKIHEDTKLHIDMIFRIVTSNNEFDI